MNINRDEALRAQALAEALMQKSDFTAARKLAIKAHSMDSTLENISHMTMVCDVHCAATEKTFGNNEMDWYGILQVDVNANEAVIKKQYRKLALLLHPDKNKLPGAESAFKLIGEAQRILLDKDMRMLHDVKRRTRPAPAPRVPSYRAQQASVNMRNVFNGVRPQGQPPHGFAPRPTFWTSCPFCGSRYEYGREHVKREVACQTCKKLFTAFEVSFPTQQNMFPGQRACAEPHKRPVDTKNVPSGKKATAASTAENNNEKRKRKRKDMDEPSESSESESSSDSEDDSNNVPPGKKATASTVENNNGKRKRKDIDECSESSDSESSSDSEDDDTMAAGNNMGSNGGQEPRRSVRSKRQVSYNENVSDDDDVDLVNDVGEGENVDTEKVDEDHHHQSTEALNPKEKIQVSLDDSEDEESSLGGEAAAEEEANVINCEDPEFSDFDKLREKSCFEERQVWALYDEGEGMPRFYAVIKKVTKPRFSVKYVWLEPDETRDLPVSVGRYVLGDEGKTSSCDLFSHLVQSKTRSNAKNFTVFPGKGETWALFKNWDMEEEEDSDSPREYEFVEILSDHEEGGGTVSVGFLSKVEGFKYVYSPLPEEEADTFEIPPHEFFRFSHRVPSFRLKGTEGRGVLEGWFELDPAALPVPGSQDHHQSPPP